MSTENVEVVELAKIQFGADEPLLYGVVSVEELVPMLVRLARSDFNRAIEVRQFFDEHQLNHLDRNNNISEILALRQMKIDRDRGDDTLTPPMKLRPRRRSKTPWWKRFF